MEYHEKSLEISEKLGGVQGKALSKLGIANILGNKKRFDDALKLYFESEKVIKKLRDLQHK